MNFKTAILSFTGFAASLLAARIVKTDSIYYLFLCWNLFLAFIPYWISNYLKKQDLLLMRHWPLLAVWLLFIPNSPYLLTDLFHLHAREGVPLWLDLILVISFALIGLVIFYRSLIDIFQLLKKQVADYWLRLMVPFTLWLIAFGLYLGRYGRFNSWDVMQHPFRLAKRSAGILLHKDAIAFTCIFSVFLWLVYLTLITFNSKGKTDA
ncbi:MAG: DUF1361 domain-containing protein [Bacteroidia bacterium]